MQRCLQILLAQTSCCDLETLTTSVCGVWPFHLCLSKLASNSPASSGCRPSPQPSNSPTSSPRDPECRKRMNEQDKYYPFDFICQQETLCERTVFSSLLADLCTANGARTIQRRTCVCVCVYVCLLNCRLGFVQMQFFLFFALFL